MVVRELLNLELASTTCPCPRARVMEYRKEDGSVHWHVRSLNVSDGLVTHVQGAHQ